jgi:Zn-dependent protease with chaperone function
MWMLRKRVSCLLATGLFLAAASEARQPGEPLKPGFNLFSKQQDVQLGQDAAKQVRQQYQPVQNQFLQDYLRRVGDRLAATPEAKQSGFSFTFSLLNVGEINAFALPGGPMFVYTGLMKVSDNEAQLAGVMAHEMSHVILRHGTHQASKANLIQLPAMLAGAVAGGSLLGQLTQLGIGLGANSVLLKFSRDAESQADALGSHLMSEAGYNPIEMARFFEKLQGTARGPQFLSDHPNPGNREHAIEAEIRALPQRAYGFETGDFQKVKAEIAALPAPPARKGNIGSGAAATDLPAPGEGWRQLRARSFSVSYPGSWQVFGDQQSSMLTIAPRQGLVRGSNGATQVGYGAILSYFSPENRTDLLSATDDLISHLYGQNPAFRVTSNSQDKVRAGGSDGLITMLASASPYGGDETDALLTVGRPEGLFYMVFIAPAKNYPQLEGSFRQMVHSLRFSE